jgi:hypothetical protein
VKGKCKNINKKSKDKNSDAGEIAMGASVSVPQPAVGSPGSPTPSSQGAPLSWSGRLDIGLGRELGHLMPENQGLDVDKESLPGLLLLTE